MKKQQGQIDDNPQSKLIRIPLSEALGIKKGVNAIIGSGGKSSLLKSLSLELSQKGSVLLTTSTHILPFSHCENICFSEEEALENSKTLLQSKVLSLWDGGGRL